MSVFLELDGKPVPIDDLSWYYYAPCGCCYGATLAEVAGQVLATEEQAWQDFWPRADKRRKKKAAGYRFELGLRVEAQKRLGVSCTHKGRKKA
jgi:hypothetical protein